jgi:hypothetical protein
VWWAVGSSFADSSLLPWLSLGFVFRIPPAPVGAAESEFVVEVCTPPAWELGHRLGLQKVGTDEMAGWADSMTNGEQCWLGCGVAALEVVKSLCVLDTVVVVVVGNNSHLAAVALLLMVVELCLPKKKRVPGTLVHKNRRWTFLNLACRQLAWDVKNLKVNRQKVANQT